MKNILKSNKTKWIITFTSLVLVVCSIIGIGVRLNKVDKTTTLSPTAYSIGTIDEAGKIVESKKALYSDLKTTESLEIDVHEDASITYKVVFYDEDENFVLISEEYSDDFNNENLPETAEYFRLVITPNQVDGEDVTLNILNMSKYTSMLTVTYAR